MLNEADIFNSRILIVDDQLPDVQFLEAFLNEAGYTAINSTTNPEEVFVHQINDQYDLILLDLHMSLLDGFQVMQKLKDNLQQGYLPVIALIAQAEHKPQVLAAGAKDFISKPFDAVEVQTRIRNMLEVRLLYKKIEEQNHQLEATLAERTAELRASEARYKRLTELASDWYWEQDEQGVFTQVSGPVMDMLGLGTDGFNGENLSEYFNAEATSSIERGGWDAEERELLHAHIAARQPFIDFTLSRSRSDGSQQYYRISGEPIFDQSCRFIGYRGIGVEYKYRVECKHKVDSYVNINNTASGKAIAR